MQPQSLCPSIIRLIGPLNSCLVTIPSPVSDTHGRTKVGLIAINRETGFQTDQRDRTGGTIKITRIIAPSSAEARPTSRPIACPQGVRYVTTQRLELGRNFEPTTICRLAHPATHPSA